MANQNNKGFNVPQLNIGNQTSDRITPIATGTGEMQDTLSSLARAADQFGAKMQKMADFAATNEGAAKARQDMQGGNAQAQNPYTAFGASYNQVMYEARAASVKTEIIQGIDQALIDHADDPEAFVGATTALRKGFGSTGSPQHDAELDNFFTIEQATGLGKARIGRQKRMLENANAAFSTSLNTHSAQIYRTIASATFDDTGNAQVGVALNDTLTTLAKYGPKTEFDVGGVHFTADPNRLGLYGADDITKTFLEVQADARRQWIEQTAEKLPDSVAKKKFAEDLQGRFQKNDPMLAGINAGQFEIILDRVTTIADKAENVEDASRREAGQNAANMIEAIRWGGHVDEAEMMRQAELSGDEGLIQQSLIFAQMGYMTPSILRKVRAGGHIGGGSGGGSDDEHDAAWTPPIGSSDSDFQAWKNIKTGFASDPIKYAHSKKVMSLPALNPDGFETDPNGWGQSLMVRYSSGQSLSQSYKVPQRMLTNAEKSYYADAMERDPSYGVRLTQAATAVIGPRGAQQLMREIGSEGRASQSVHMGDLVAMGSRSIVNQATEGQALRAQGAKGEKISEQFDAIMPQYTGAFSGRPNTLLAARQTAEDAMLSDQAKGIKRKPEYYLNSALGATSKDGRVYGGVAKYNGRDVSVPNWLARDNLDDALYVVYNSWAQTGGGVYYDNGQPMTLGAMRRLRLEPRPNGNYVFINPDTNRPAVLKNGRPAEINFDKQRDFIRAKLPKAVK